MSKLKSVDFTKGICMILIVFGHIFPVPGHPLMVYSYAFHVPAYFIISGILMERNREEQRPIGALLKNNLLRLMVPYFCFEGIYTVHYGLSHGFSYSGVMLRQTWMLSGAGIATWFLPVLFLAKLYVLMLRRFLRRPWLVALACLLPMAAVIPIPYEAALSGPVPVVIMRACNAVGLIWIGTALHRYLERLTASRWVLILSLVISAAAALANGRISLLNMHYRTFWLYPIAAVTGTVAMLCIGTILPENRLISFIGKNSMIVMSTHQLLMVSLDWSVAGNLGSWSWTVVLTLILLLEIPLCLGIRRYLPFLLGGWYPKKHPGVDA